MSGAEDCRHVRLQIGADPQSLSAEVQAHLATCAQCRKFRDETLMLDARVRAALELPLNAFRTAATTPTVAAAQTAARPRRFALAASVLLALSVAGGVWLLRPQSALAGEVIEHVLHEPGSWDARTQMPAGDVARVLDMAGVDFDASVPVVYAAPCSFRGRRIAHLVVQAPTGPLTVMLLPHVSVEKRREFSEEGLRGMLLPAGSGSVAVLTHGAELPDAFAGSLVSSVRWR